MLAAANCFSQDKQSAETQDSIIKHNISFQQNLDADKSYNKGIKLFKDKKYSEALAYFDQAIRLKPNFEKAYFNRAGIKFETKDYRGAIDDLNKVIELNAKYEKAYYNRAKSKYANASLYFLSLNNLIPLLYDLSASKFC